MAGDAETEGNSCSAISFRQVEYGHIRGGKRGIWDGVDRTDVGSP